MHECMNEEVRDLSTEQACTHARSRQSARQGPERAGIEAGKASTLMAGRHSVPPAGLQAVRQACKQACKPAAKLTDMQLNRARKRSVKQG